MAGVHESPIPGNPKSVSLQKHGSRLVHTICTSSYPKKQFRPTALLYMKMRVLLLCSVALLSFSKQNCFFFLAIPAWRVHTNITSWHKHARSNIWIELWWFNPEPAIPTYNFDGSRRKFTRRSVNRTASIITSLHFCTGPSGRYNLQNIGSVLCGGNH